MNEWASTYWMVFQKHRPAGAYLPTGQMDGDCHSCGGSWPCGPVQEALDAREKALREEVEANAYKVLRAACMHALMGTRCKVCASLAARIAQGEAR